MESEDLKELDPDKVIQQHLLVTPGMGVPDNIKPVEGMDYGQCTIFVNGDMNDRVTGWHVVLEGKTKDMYAWLGQFDGYWQGNGTPFMEKFNIMHIKKEVYEHFKQLVDS